MDIESEYIVPENDQPFSVLIATSLLELPGGVNLPL